MVLIKASRRAVFKVHRSYFSGRVGLVSALLFLFLLYFRALNGMESPILVFTLAALIAFVVLIFVQDTDDIFLTAVFGIVLWSSTSPILESATLRAAERSGLSYGAVRVWLSIAFVASNVVCGLLVSQLGFSIVAPWLAVACGFQLWGIWALPLSEGGKSAGTFGPHFRATFAEARELLGKPVFLLFLAVCSLIQGSHIVYYTYAGLIWREQGMNAAVIGLIWPLGVIAEILLFVFSARVVRRIDPVMLIGIGAAACSLRWAMMAFDPGPLLLWIAQLLHGLTFAVPHLGAMYFILRATPPRLSATASEFSEWLASSPYAQEVTPDQLLNYLGGVPEIYGADARPKKLEWMLRQAKSLSGK